MPKKFTIKWTPNAIDTLEDNLKSVLLKWGVKIAKSVDEDISNLLVLLESNNKLCPSSKIKNIRKCKVSKQTSLVYRVKGYVIELIAFIPNQSNHKY